MTKTNEKKTVAQNFEEILNVLHNAGVNEYDEFIASRIKLTHKDNSKSKAAKAKANEPIAKAIADYLAGCENGVKANKITYAVANILNNDELSIQKIVSVMNDMGNVKREKVGKDSLYSLC